MELINNGCEPAIINIYDAYKNSSLLHYFRNQNKLHYLEQNNLSFFIKENESQLLKVLNSKRTESYFQGFELEFVIIPGFYFVQNEDFANYIIVDRSKNQIRVSVQQEPRKNIHEIYTDGSYFNLDNKTGYAYIIRYPDGEEKLYQEKIFNKGNNIAELAAVAAALDKLAPIKEIRICTDSRYVIKGLTQWVHYWKINQWKTVNNENVKHIDTWKKCETLTQDKYVEFKWIKSHSNHLENSICDMMAKEAANKKKEL